MRKWIYILVSLVIVAYISSSFLDFHYGIATVSAIFFPVCLLVFLYKIDVFERERFKDILVVFFLGIIFSFFLSKMIYVPLREDIFGSMEVVKSLSLLAKFKYMFFGVAMPEEIIKIIPVIIVLKRTKFINEPIDYLIYASASALGFAFLENISYIYLYKEKWPNILAIRSLLPTFMHMTTSTLFAFGLFFYMETKKIKYVIIFFILAILTHALYNTIATHIFFIIIVIYYARLIQSLINISPFYDEKKVGELRSGVHFLTIILLLVLVINLVFVYYSVTIVQGGVFKADMYSYSSIIFAFIIYRAISYYLKINKGEFKLFGKGNLKIFSEMQETLIKNYYVKIGEMKELKQEDPL